MKPSPAIEEERYPFTADERELLVVLRAWDVLPGEAIRRVSAGPVVRDPRTETWKRKPGQVPPNWRVVG